MSRASVTNPGVQAPQMTVSQLNHQARLLLEQGFSMITVEGEISNFVRPSSGHWYFTLKDDRAQVRCALFRNRNAFLKYQPSNGDQVRLRARVSLYEGRGEFQLIGDFIEEAGAGALQAAFEALKYKLQQEGLFDATSKQTLPALPKHIGVITSPTGAAIRDILSVLKRRFPAIPVSIYPAAVQGEEAPAQLIKALQLAQQDQRCDVLIIGRGGGSIEDLWAFNDESLARAIYACTLPIISAVGHETDFTIADFVADLRAPTPSAAAEQLSPDQQKLLEQFRDYQRRLQRQLQQTLGLQQLRLNGLRQRLRHPGQRLQEQAQRLDQLEIRLQQNLLSRLQQQQTRLHNLEARLQRQAPEQGIRQRRERLMTLYQRLQQHMEYRLQQWQWRLGSQSQALHAISPLATLDRGYAIVTDPQGQIIRHAGQCQIGQSLNARLGQGQLTCTVDAVQAYSEPDSPGKHE